MLPMRLLLLICIVGVIGGIAQPYNYEDADETPEWMWFPDGDGKLHYIHLREDKTEPGPRFSPSQDVKFHLFTRRNVDNSQLLILDNLASIRSSNFNGTTETFFICHGWTNNANSKVNKELKNAYLASADYNVVVVDWETGAAANYVSARGHAKSTGQQIGKFITFLVKQAKVSLKRVHLVGHSLGAHAVGHAGKTVINSKIGRVNTVTGLDPASPLYSWNEPNERIDAADGDYVEIIHTNGGNLGFWQPLGHADFYPNFGSKQPGCGADLSGSCSHARAYKFLASSILRPQAFRARKCKDLNQLINQHCREDGNVYLMGGKHNKKRAHGVFILKTGENPPFV